jgi:hypothetical protein
MSASTNPTVAKPSVKDRLVTLWRLLQKLDVDGWRKLRDSTPLRLARWLLAIGVVIATWDVLGKATSVTELLLPLALVVLLVLPDAASISLGGFTYQARQAVDDAKQVTREARHVLLTIDVAGQTGTAAADSAMAREQPAEPATQALQGFL